MAVKKGRGARRGRESKKKSSIKSTPASGRRDGVNYDTLVTISHLLILVGAVIVAAATYGSFHFGKLRDREKEAAAESKARADEAKKATSGVLTPERNTILSARLGKFPKLEIGDSGAIYAFTGDSKDFLYRMAKDSQLTVATDEKGEMKVSVLVRDAAGRVIAEIVENEWKTRPDNSWDRNYSQSALEVKNDRGDVVFQVRLLEDRVQLQAVLYDEQGGGVALISDGPGQGGRRTHIPRHLARDLTPEQKEKLKIRPMFRYPSERHLGEMVSAWTDDRRESKEGAPWPAQKSKTMGERPRDN